MLPGFQFLHVRQSELLLVGRVRREPGPDYRQHRRWVCKPTSYRESQRLKVRAEDRRRLATTTLSKPSSANRIELGVSNAEGELNVNKL